MIAHTEASLTHTKRKGINVNELSIIEATLSLKIKSTNRADQTCCALCGGGASEDRLCGDDYR